MNNKDLYKDNYDKLDINKKHEILNHIAKYYGFQIKEYKEFEKDNIKLYTAIYEYDGAEFVFIPGVKNISLGYKARSSYKKENIEIFEKVKSIFLDYFLSPKVNQDIISSQDLKLLKSHFNKRKYKQLDKHLTKVVVKFLDNHSSYSRKVTIKPMLIERRSININWLFDKEIPNNILPDSKQYFKIYQDIIKSGKNFIIKKHPRNKDKIEKFEISRTGLKIYYYINKSHEELLYSYITKGYNIPNRDQWEYIATCGNPLFFQRDIDEPVEIDYTNTPNGFGVFIADDIHKPEIISDNRHSYKSGDNGYFKNYVSKKLANFSLNPFYNISPMLFNYNDNSGLYARKMIVVDLKKQFKPSIPKKDINKYISACNKEDDFDNVVYAINLLKNPKLSFNNALKLIKIYHYFGFISKAYDIVRQYSHMGTRDSEFLYFAGFTAFKSQDYERAEHYLTKAIKIKRNIPECYQILAYLYHRTGKYKEMEKAMHDLFILSPEIAKDLVQIINPKSLSFLEKDYEDMWIELVLDLSKYDYNRIYVPTITSEVVLLDSTVKLIIYRGVEGYIKYIRGEGSKYLKDILEKIENSQYIQDERFLSKDDFAQAMDEFTACKNIIYELENITNTHKNKEYLQELTNTFFDYFPALITFACIHYSNSRLFEATKVFDYDYDLCGELYKAKEVPIHVIDKIRVVLEEFILNITLNIVPYGQIQDYIDDVLDEVADIKDNYAQIAQWLIAIDLSVARDIKYILEWFEISIDFQFEIILE